MKTWSVPSFAALVVLGLLLSPATNADSPPPPPPPTLAGTVQGSTLIFVGTGVELLQKNVDGRIVTVDPAVSDPLGASVFLKVKVEEILFCKEPCRRETEVIVGLRLNRQRRDAARELFLRKTQIFLLFDRPFGIIRDFPNTWYAQNAGNANFFLPLDRRSDVLSAIKKRKD